MTDKNSFDPKKWSLGESESKGDVNTGRDALPEAWQTVVSEQCTEPPPVNKARRTGPILAFVGFLVPALGAGAFWLQNPATSSPVDDSAVVKEFAVPGVLAPQSPMLVASRRLVVAKPADLQGALRAADLSAEEIAEASKAALAVLGNAKEQIQAVISLSEDDGIVRLQRLEASLPDGSGAVIARGEDGVLKTSRVAAELSQKIKVVRGELDSESFYTSAVTAGVVDSLIPEFVNAFWFDFDLQQEVAPGDTFEVAYEQTVNAAGQPLGEPQLLFASLVTAAKSRALYRFKPVNQEVGWFDGNGSSSVRSFMRTPVEGARITSKFGPRFHPVLHYTRLHGGTDFGAPVGTPIYAAAAGSILSATPSKCAGNMVTMRHDNGWETRYFHLSRYAEGLKAGQRINQGFVIGLVGNTGTCTTGPHLHYEVHIEGQKVDPQTIKTESGRGGLAGSSRLAFFQQRDRVDVARARKVQ